MNIYARLPISQEMIDKFEPTRLYIKELNGVKYFGKSSNEDIYSYTGSGVVWIKRIKKYGKENIKTLWVSDWYYDPYILQEVALHFSEENQIVESTDWDNMRPENGFDGQTRGYMIEWWDDDKREAKSKSNIGTNNPRYDPTMYSFTHEDGTTVLMTMYEFKQMTSIKSGKVSQLISGKRQSTYGWRLTSTPIEETGQERVKKALTDNTIYTFIHLDGRTVSCTRKEFMTISGISRGCIGEIVRDSKQYKDWKLV